MASRQPADPAPGSSAREEFAARLTAARLAQHLSIGTVAKMVGIPKATAQGWLNGSHLPTPALRPQYLELAAVLGVADGVPEGLWLDRWPAIKPRLGAAGAPYLGLRPFTVGDAANFHGRASQSRRLAEAVLDLSRAAGHGVIVLVGPSGCGKSSLLAAGLVGRECVAGVLAGWRARCLAHDALDGDPGPARLLVVDQFEDLLLLPAAERHAPLARVGELAADRIIVLGLRSDAFAEAQAEPLLTEALARPVLVAPLTRDELREAVVAPARLAGVEVDDDLVHVLLTDLDPGAERGPVPADLLPLLSNALLVTWAAGSGERMTLADYRKAGGVAGAVETLAEQVYTDLDEPEQAAAQRLFLRLVGPVHDVVLRRTLPLAEVGPQARPVMDAFVAARMLVVSDDRVRISHEALVRHWRRLAGWIDEHRSELDALATVRRAAELWEDNDRDPQALVPVQRLAALGAWLDDPDRRDLLEGTQREYLAASEAHFTSALDDEKRMSRRLRTQRRLALGLALVTTIAGAGAAAAFVRSEGYRGDAEAARNEAQSRQIATAAGELRSRSPNLQAQLAMVANRLADTREARSAVLDAAASDVPTRWLGAPNATVAVSPDGELVARADGSGSVTLWRGDEVARGQGSTFVADSGAGALLGVAFAGVGGRSILAVAGANTRSLWDVTGEPTRLVEIGATGASAVAFNPAGNRVAFGDAGGGATVYDLGSPDSPREVARVRPSGADVPTNAVALDAGGLLYVAGVRGEVDRWRIADKPERLAPLPVSVAGPEGRLAVRAQALALTSDGTQLAAGLAGTEVARWRIDPDGDAHAEPPLTGFTEFVNGVVFSPDAATIAVAGADQSISVFAAASGELQRRVFAPSPQSSVGLTASGAPVSTGGDGTLLVWPAVPPLWKRSGAVIYNLSSEGTGWLAGGSSTDGIALWRLGDAPKRMATPVPPALEADDYQVGAVAVAPSGRFLLGSSMQGKVLSWPLTDAGAGAGRAFDSGTGLSIIFIATSPDSSLVAAMSARASEVILFRADADGALTRLSSVSVGTPQLVGFSADGGLLAIAQADRQVSLWSVADPSHPAQVGAITGLASAPTTLDLSPAGPRIAVGESSGRVSVWDVSRPTRPTELRAWTDASSDLYSLEFSRDEQQLIGTSGDDVIWGWRLDSPATQAEFALDGEIGRPWDVRFLADGRHFAASGDQGAVRVWNSTPSLAVTDLCSRVGDQLTADEWHRYLPGIEPRRVC